jgi:hypothetical protein
MDTLVCNISIIFVCIFVALFASCFCLGVSPGGTQRYKIGYMTLKNTALEFQKNKDEKTNNSSQNIIRG